MATVGVGKARGVDGELLGVRAAAIERRSNVMVNQEKVLGDRAALPRPPPPLPPLFFPSRVTLHLLFA